MPRSYAPPVGQYFCGDEDDVLVRLQNAAKQFHLDYFLGITADNPLITIHYSNLIVDEIKIDQYDFIKLEGLPFGTATYGMNVKALETVCKIKTILVVAYSITERRAISASVRTTS